VKANKTLWKEIQVTSAMKTLEIKRRKNSNM